MASPPPEEAAAPPPERTDPPSSTRLYLGNLPPDATKADIEDHFRSHGTGDIAEIKLMSGFGFIEYKDSMDARDVVPAFHGSMFKGKRLVVQFARGSRPKEQFYHQERPPPRPRRTVFRMSITGIPPETSWQDLKDFARPAGPDPVYSEVSRERDGRGFVEYETEADLNTAVDKLDQTGFKDLTVTCIADIQPERPRDRFRSRSPPPRRGYGAPRYDDYGRPPPRGYSPRGYRDRSPPPPPRRDFYDRDRYDRSPPPARGRGPMDDGFGPPPPRRPYPEDPYPPARYPPRGGGYEPEYGNGYRGGFERQPSPRRPRSPPRGGYDAPYDRRGY